MKSFLVLSLILISVLGLKMQDHNQQNAPLLVGGYATQDVNNMSDNMKEIDTYLKSTFPQLASYKLTDAQTQVVAGMNYKYTYSNDANNLSFEYIVYDQPWTSTRQVSSVKRIQKSFNENGDEVTTTKTLIQGEGQYLEAVNGLFK